MSSPSNTDMSSKQAYDSHCNLVLGDVEESIYSFDDDDEGGAAQDIDVKPIVKKSEMLFVRGMRHGRIESYLRSCSWDQLGDSVVLISPFNA